MKKIPLLLGMLGGAFAGYLFNNTKLRNELAKVNDAEEAAKILGKHLSSDGKKLAKEAQKFVKSEEVQENLATARKYAEEQAKKWGKEVQAYVEKGTKTMKKQAKKTIASAKKSMKG